VRTLRDDLLAAERSRLHLTRHGELRVAVGYPNTYEVAMSSLAYQWLVELTAATGNIGVERFFAEDAIIGITVESGGGLVGQDVLAWTCAFELDAVHILRTLDAAGIRRLRQERRSSDPLLVVGGPVATINPLPLTPVVDVFCLGAAERLWQPLLEAVCDEPDRDRLLARLAGLEGYLVPAHHLDGRGRPIGRFRRLENRPNARTGIPASNTVTPNTVYRDRGLIEISRGCPERCGYCWISFSSGRLRPHPVEEIIGRLDELGDLSPRIGLVATAVGDHPHLPEILAAAREREMDVAVSSLRIPALRSEVLDPLAACGARSLTVAPETGSDGLRRRLGKAIDNRSILAGLERARGCGFEGAKMYFILGLPGETEADVVAIADLADRASRIFAQGARRSRRSAIQLSVSPLVPKPYTPLHAEAMLDRREWNRRIRLLADALPRGRGIRLQRGSHREALWQGFLSRAGSEEGYELLAQAADGRPLSALLGAHAETIARTTSAFAGHQAPWHFIATAPQVPGSED
jgi:radical SAM superfamily enzyme YgiQ (UPF0313 family)